MKNNINRAIVVLFILILIIFGVVLFRMNQRTPYEYLQNHFEKTVSDEILYPTKMLYQTNYENNENITIIFYRNANTNFSFAIVEKTLFYYKMLEYSGELNFQDGKSEYKYGYYTGSYLGSWYDYDGQRKALFWGINKDESVEKLLVDGKESECAEINDDNGINFKLFWIIGDWEDSPDFREIQAQATE